MRILRPTRPSLLGLLVLLAVGFAPAAARAQQFTLDQLLVPGTTVVVDDKIFSGWSFNSVAFGGANPVNPAFVSVRFSQPDPFTVRVDFQSAQFFAGAGQQQDTIIEYDVRTVSGQPLIVDNHLAINAGAVQPGGRIAIAELVTDENGAFVADKLVFITDSQAVLRDDAFFAPQDALHVAKDIGVTGPAFLSDFSQEITQIPEPATVGLVSLGALGMGAYGWRRRKQPATV